MYIIWILWAVLLFFNFSYSAEEVNIYATVWSINKEPRFTYFNPDTSPLILPRWSTQTIAFWCTDPEWHTIYVSISSDNWIVNPTSQELEWWWDLNMLYKAPNDLWWQSLLSDKIYIILNDSVNVVVKEIDLYIY